METTPLRWIKTEGGYRASTVYGDVLLQKSGKKWTLIFQGQTHALPAKTTFDHADRLFAKLVVN